MMSKPWKHLLVAAALAASCTAALSAQQAAPPTPAAQDEEEVFDDKLREFGYWSGAAFACVAADKQAEVERKVLDTFNGIARLFGTDRAFFYAAAFGNGTTHKVDPAKCPEFLEKFQQATAVPGGKK
jgi:2-methylcitrate dehydratase PrpD